MARSNKTKMQTQYISYNEQSMKLQILKTDPPAHHGIIDVVEAITGQAKKKNTAAKTLDRITESYPEVSPNWKNFRFPT